MNFRCFYLFIAIVFQFFSRVVPISIPFIAIIASANKQQEVKRAENFVIELAQEQARLRHVQLSNRTIEDDTWEVIMERNHKTIYNLVRHGILNMHEANRTMGINNAERRLRTESVLAGGALSNPLSSEAKRHLPKYAYLSHPDLPDSLTGYGYFAIIMKPSVKKRITWTPFDSFDYLSESFAQREEKIREGLINTLWSNTIPHQEGTYVEAQIWGPLDIDDVAEISFYVKDPENLMSEREISSLNLNEIEDLRHLLKQNIKFSYYTSSSLGSLRQRTLLTDEQLSRFDHSLKLSSMRLRTDLEIHNLATHPSFSCENFLR